MTNWNCLSDTTIAMLQGYGVDDSQAINVSLFYSHDDYDRYESQRGRIGLESGNIKYFWLKSSRVGENANPKEALIQALEIRSGRVQQELI